MTDPTFSPVKTSRRTRAGAYRVTLTNGASASVHKEDSWWAWDCEPWDLGGAGGCRGFDTKREAIECFREYRG